MEDCPTHLDRLRIDEDTRQHTGLRTTVDPIVDRPALHEDIARLQMDDRVIKFHVNLAREDDEIVDGIGPVVPWGHPRSKLEQAKYRAVGQRRPGRPLASVRVAGVVHREAFRGPDVPRCGTWTG